MTDSNNEKTGIVSGLFQDLVQLKDELALQAHLMNMEMKDEWDALYKRAVNYELKLKHSLEDLTEEVGKTEEHFFVGDENELQKLIDEFKDLKDRHTNHSNGNNDK